MTHCTGYAAAVAPTRQIAGEWLAHQKAEILFHPHDQTFTAQLYRAGLIINGRQIRRLHGSWIRKRGILLSAVVLGSP
jgi:hypothetical protein